MILMCQVLKRPHLKNQSKNICNQINAVVGPFSSTIEHSCFNYFPRLHGSLRINNAMLLRSVSNVLMNTTTLQHVLLIVKTLLREIYI